MQYAPFDFSTSTSSCVTLLYPLNLNLNKHARYYLAALLSKKGKPELGTFEWWISGLMLNSFFFLNLHIR